MEHDLPTRRKKLPTGPGAALRDLGFAAVVAVYVLVIGQNWGVYAAATMIAAYAQRGGRLLMPV